MGRWVIQESATSWERTKFEMAVREALSLYGNGEIEALLFPRVDRETRFLFGSIPLLAEVVKSGLRVYFAREKLMLDPDDLDSIERYLSKATQAQAYIQTMKLNTGRAKKKLVRAGKLPQGTGTGLYGYDWDRSNKKRVINSTEEEIVRGIFTRVAAGDSMVSIARSLNERGIPTKGSTSEQRKLWHSLTIRRMVRNSGYVGQTYFNNTLLEDVTPAIMSEELYQAANAELDKPKARTGRPKNDYLLRHHAYCALCGKPLVGHCLNKIYRYYQCSNARPFENKQKQCSARYIRAGELEDTVWARTKDILSKPEIILDQIQEHLIAVTDHSNIAMIEADITQLEKNLGQYEKRRSNLLEAIELGEFSRDEILDRLNKIKRLSLEDAKKLDDATALKQNLTGLATAKVKVKDMYVQVLSNLQDCTEETKALALDALDIKVYASTDKVEIQGIIPLELPTTARTSA